MRDLVALAYEISQKEENSHENTEKFCRKLGRELLHMKDANIINDLSCAVDLKAKQYVVNLRIDFPTDIGNS